MCNAICQSTVRYPASMKQNRIDDAVLALLYLGIHDHDPVTGARTWKSFNWDAMNRLHEIGATAR